ncbi:MAG TPA: DUF2079 domain-containing protein [Acidimicrobiia bacterium]|nr:DUF2079 domain-containing protein [Acidimicrobiia bacterium]
MASAVVIVPAQGTPEPPPSGGRRLLSLDRRSLALGIGLAMAVFLAAWYRHQTFRSGSLDLAVYDQAVWKLAHFRAPDLSTIGWNAFADHFSPALLLFAPLYRLAATPLWLLASQAVALGVGFLAVGPLLDTVGVTGRWRGAFRFAYLASPLLWNAALYDFHTTTLAVPFLLVGLRAALLDRRRLLVGCLLALLILRDDLGLTAAAVALAGFGSLDRDGRRLRLLLAAGALAWMAAGGGIAALLGSDRHWAFHYGYLAGSPGAAVLHPVRTTGRLVVGLARWDNATLIGLGLLAPLGLLPALAPRRLALAALPLLPLMASAGSQFHSIRFQYGAYLFPFALLAAASAVPRARRAAAVLDDPKLAVAGTAVVLAAAGPLGQLTAPVAPTADYQRALAHIGPHETVMATDEIGPHLSERADLLLFPFAVAAVGADFPLPAAARTPSAAKAATIDAIVVGPVLHPESAPAYEAFARSPYLAEFPYVTHFGAVTLYRRTPG